MHYPEPTLRFRMFYLVHLADAYKVMTHGLVRQALYILSWLTVKKVYNSPVALVVCLFDLDFAT
jgi:hypothetical protein